MAGTVRVTEKPVLDSAQQADYFVCVQDGKVKLAAPGSIGDVVLVDVDDNEKKYYCNLLIKNGHLVIAMEPESDESQSNTPVSI